MRPSVALENDFAALYQFGRASVLAKSRICRKGSANFSATGGVFITLKKKRQLLLLPMLQIIGNFINYP
jgi:hypothetical protein